MPNDESPWRGRRARGARACAGRAAEFEASTFRRGGSPRTWRPRTRTNTAVARSCRPTAARRRPANLDRMTSPRRVPSVLSIAGSDSGGGAGIQADLKAFARCGVHGTTAITAITAQNTVGGSAIHPVPPRIILAQVRAVLGDIGADAVKVGMLATAPTARAVARALRELPDATPVVVDPVMVAESGAQLLDRDARRVLIEQIIPRATVLTPNLPEARAIAGAAGRGRGEPG